MVTFDTFSFDIPHHSNVTKIPRVGPQDPIDLGQAHFKVTNFRPKMRIAGNEFYKRCQTRLLLHYLLLACSEQCKQQCDGDRKCVSNCEYACKYIRVTSHDVGDWVLNQGPCSKAPNHQHYSM